MTAIRPPDARRPATLPVVVVVSALAGAVLGAVLATGSQPSWAGIALVAVCVTAGEALSIRLPYGDGQVARFGHGDAVILAGIVLLPLPEVVWGAATGVALQHLLHRPPVIKSVYNVAQMTLATAAAATAFALLAGPTAGTPVTPGTVPPYLAATAVFMLVNATLVGTVVATVTDGRVLVATRRLLPATAVLTAGGACLGLLALGLMDEHPYLLPVMGVPLVFVMTGSRQQVDAQVREERSDRLVAYERSLDASVSVADVEQALVEGIAAVAHASAALWRAGRWVTSPPPGDGVCDVLPSTEAPVRAPARSLGVAADGPGLAVPVDGGVLVAWGGDLGVLEDTADWIMRLARSASEHAERTRAHTALLHERAMLQMVVDGTSDGIYVLDSDARLQLLNPAATELFGTSADTAGRPVGRVLGPGDWTTPGVRDVEWTDAGTHRTLRVAVAAVSDRGVGDLRVGVVHDVSAERRVARMKDDMLAVVSHELRTPLTPIRAAARMLVDRGDRVPPARRRALLEQIDDRAGHLTRLVEDLLLVAQLSSERGTVPMAQAADVDVAADVAALVATVDLARPQRVRYRGPKELVLRTDAQRLRQIVDNLLDNACKFSPATTTVLVDMVRDADTVRIAVTDEGCGIRREDLGRIFERFERAEDPMVMQTSGAGLGLYIVRSLVTALGGDLQVTSSYGLGTTMTVLLPVDGHRLAGNDGGAQAADAGRVRHPDAA